MDEEGSTGAMKIYQGYRVVLAIAHTAPFNLGARVFENQLFVLAIAY